MVGGTASANLAEADLQNSFVMRRGEVLGVDFARLLRKGDLSQNIFLQPDDFVYMRPGVGQSVYVLGAVPRAGAVPFVDKISLISAIAAAGGTLPYARFWDVAIVRGSLGKPSIASVSYRSIAKGHVPDVLLEAGDIVYVPFSPFAKIGPMADAILKEFVGTIALNEGIRAVSRNASPVGISVGVGSSVGTLPVGVGIGR